MDLKTEILEYIREHKKNRKLSRLAQEVGIERAWFDKVLKGSRSMRLDTAQKLLDHKYGIKREHTA